MTHSEAVALAATAAELDGPALLGAHVYLHIAGAVPRAELVRVLATHLEVGAASVSASIDRLVGNHLLQMTDSTVSLPAGGDDRETEER